MPGHSSELPASSPFVTDGPEQPISTRYCRHPARRQAQAPRPFTLGKPSAWRQTIDSAPTFKTPLAGFAERVFETHHAMERSLSVERFDELPFLSGATATGNLVFIGGTLGGPRDNDLSVADQMRDILRQVDRRLNAAGSSKDGLLFVQIWLADINDWSEMNEAWVEWLGECPAPARATVESRLAFGYRVEVAGVATRAGAPRQ